MQPDFEFDPAKSIANHEKHGIDFLEAQALWAEWGLLRRLEFPLEPRFLRTARYADRIWSAVFTERSGRVRLISVRRARLSEVEDYEAARQAEGQHDHKP